MLREASFHRDFGQVVRHLQQRNNWWRHTVAWLPWGDVVGVTSIIVIVGGGQELLTLPPCMGVFLRWCCRVSPHVRMCGAVLQFPRVLRADPDGLPGIVVDRTE